MIICCHTEITHQWSEQELTDKLMLLPVDLQRAALGKKQWVDSQLSIGGKLVLIEVLKQIGRNDLTLDLLKYNTHHRPYFDADIDFNISHSANIIVCCATQSGQIGIDIEEINIIDLTDYTDYFTPNEWGKIHNYPNQFAGFYDFWTRKEAVLKAVGTGFHTPLSSVDVSSDSLTYDDILYYIQPLYIGQGYKSHIATTIDSPAIRITKVNL